MYEHENIKLLFLSPYVPTRSRERGLKSMVFILLPIGTAREYTKYSLFEIEIKLVP